MTPNNAEGFVVDNNSDSDSHSDSGSIEDEDEDLDCDCDLDYDELVNDEEGGDIINNSRSRSSSSSSEIKISIGDSNEQQGVSKEKEDKDKNENENSPSSSSSSVSLLASFSNAIRRAKMMASLSSYAATATATASATALSLLYAYERRNQKQLTSPPIIMGQLPSNTIIRSVYEKLLIGTSSNVGRTSYNSNSNGDNTGTRNNENKGIFTRPIVPKMFIGTNGQISSAMAYLNPGPSPTSKSKSTTRFTETITSSYDGAKIYLDWEIPGGSGDTDQTQNQNRKDDIVSKGRNRIQQPIVLILHGINNSSKFGYMKSLSRTFVKKRGWNSVSMNFRGISGVSSIGDDDNMATPRSYNAAYTGDIRSIVNQLSSRLVQQQTTQTGHIPYLFLVGNSLGAMIITKYLGEEGLANTLPLNVLGGVSLGNPFKFHSDKIKSPFNEIMGIARKMNYHKQRKSMNMIQQQSSSSGGTANVTTNVINDVTTNIRNISLSSLDRIIAPYMIRNSVHPPYETKIGYGHSTNTTNNDSNSNSINAKSRSKSDSHDMHDADSAAIEYWYDSSCYRQQRHITIPYMHIIAKDDYLCYNNAMQTYILNYTLNNNPNIILVTTQCGGHLGWQQSESSESSKIEIDSKSESRSRSSSRSSSWFGNSWADNATSDFFQAIIDTNTNHNTDTDTNTSIKEKEEKIEEETNRQTRADANAIRLEQNRRIENQEAIGYSRRYRSRL